MENFWVKTGVAAVISFLTAKSKLQQDVICRGWFLPPNTIT